VCDGHGIGYPRGKNSPDGTTVPAAADENRGLDANNCALQGDKRQLAERIDGAAKSTRDPAQADPRIRFRMNQKSKTLDVTIMGRTYKVACTEEERNALLSAVAYLDRR